MSATLANQHIYTNENLGLLKSIIREYDMREAGFNLIKEYGLLKPSKIKYLEENFTKQERTIEIGKLQNSNKYLAKNMMEAFKEARKQFCDMNEIENEDILSIKKDAIFIIKKQCRHLKFGDYIEFSMKNRYSSYCYLNKMEFYYSVWNDNFDIKGATNKEHPLLKHICNIIKYNEKSNKELIFKQLQKLRIDYLERSLPVEYYRELNPNNSFKLLEHYARYSLYLDNTTKKFLDQIDISYNYINFIIPLISILI